MRPGLNPPKSIPLKYYDLQLDFKVREQDIIDKIIEPTHYKKNVYQQPAKTERGTAFGTSRKLTPERPTPPRTRPIQFENLAIKNSFKRQLTPTDELDEQEPVNLLYFRSSIPSRRLVDNPKVAIAMYRKKAIETKSQKVIKHAIEDNDLETSGDIIRKNDNNANYRHSPGMIIKGLPQKKMHRGMYFAKLHKREHSGSNLAKFVQPVQEKPQIHLTTVHPMLVLNEQHQQFLPIHKAKRPETTGTTHRELGSTLDTRRETMNTQYSQTQQTETLPSMRPNTSGKSQAFIRMQEIQRVKQLVAVKKKYEFNRRQSPQRSNSPRPIEIVGKTCYTANDESPRVSMPGLLMESNLLRRATEQSQEDYIQPSVQISGGVSHRIVDYAHQQSHRSSVETFQNSQSSELRPKTSANMRSANNLNNVDANQLLQSILGMSQPPRIPIKTTMKPKTSPPKKRNFNLIFSQDPSKQTLGASISNLTVEAQTRLMATTNSHDDASPKRRAPAEPAEDGPTVLREGHYVSKRYSQPKVKMIVKATDHLHLIGENKPKNDSSLMLHANQSKHSNDISIPNFSIPTIQITNTTIKSPSKKDKSHQELSKITNKHIELSNSWDQKLEPFKGDKKNDESYEYF